MMKILRLALAPLTALFYLLGGFIPRRKNRWIFGSHSNAFSDNSKHLYIHIVENHPEIDAIWITANPKIRDSIRASGGKALSRWSLKGLMACLTGQYWFVSVYVTDINFYCSRNAILVNLWHGIPLKKIEFDIKNGPLADRFQNSNIIKQFIHWPSIFRRPDYVVSSSPRVSHELFMSAFRLGPKQCWETGFPRTDGFYKQPSERLLSIIRWDPPATRELVNKISLYNQCLIYMPTWRDTSQDFISSSGWDFPALNESLKQQNILLLLKLHFNTPQSTLQQAANLSNIHLMQPTEDAYSVLPCTTGLVTDYSSIFFDYLLLDKPIYFYPFDRKEYELDSRGFYFPYESFTPGRHITSPSELTNPCLSEDVHTYAEARRSLREIFFTHVDANAAERIVNRIKSSKLN